MSPKIGLDPIPGCFRLNPDTAYLRLCNGSKADHRFSLNRIRTLIGRSDPPHIIVDIDLTTFEQSDPPMISRRHALIEWMNNKLQVTDLASRNGTYVDGEKLEPEADNQPSKPASLKIGSKLILANLEFEVLSEG